MTGITHYENGKLTVFATDYAIENRLPLISGTEKKGVTITVTVKNVSEGCEADESDIKIEIIPEKRPVIDECDLTDASTHNHEFEVIMKKVLN